MAERLELLETRDEFRLVIGEIIDTGAAVIDDKPKLERIRAGLLLAVQRGSSRDEILRITSAALRKAILEEVPSMEHRCRWGAALKVRWRLEDGKSEAANK